MNADTPRSLEQLESALQKLAEALAVPRDAPLAVDGTIQRFEFTIELYWKVLKRLLEAEGIQAATPREAMRRAFQAGWIDDEAAWLDMLQNRNLTSHTYNEALAGQVYDAIRRDFAVLEAGVQGLARRSQGQ